MHIYKKSNIFSCFGGPLLHVGFQSWNYLCFAGDCKYISKSDALRKEEGVY